MTAMPFNAMTITDNTPLTPALRQMIEAMQSRIRKDVEAKTHWTDADFEDRLNCAYRFRDDAKTVGCSQWVPISELESLAFDPRTPQHSAERLLYFLKSAKAHGMLD